MRATWFNPSILPCKTQPNSKPSGKFTMPNLLTEFIVRGNPSLKPTPLRPSTLSPPPLLRRVNGWPMPQQQIRHHPPKHHTPVIIQMRHISGVKVVRLRIRAAQCLDISQTGQIEVQHPHSCILSGGYRR